VCPDKKPDISDYVSPHVFDGKRPLSKKRIEQLRKKYGLEDGTTPPFPIPRPGFWDSLTPEQKKAALEYDGPCNFGPPTSVWEHCPICGWLDCRCDQAIYKFDPIIGKVIIGLFILWLLSLIAF
jgi:hypothetical protein